MRFVIKNIEVDLTLPSRHKKSVKLFSIKCSMPERLETHQSKGPEKLLNPYFDMALAVPQKHPREI
jgi:hypothetical protein